MVIYRRRQIQELRTKTNRNSIKSEVKYECVGSTRQILACQDVDVSILVLVVWMVGAVCGDAQVYHTCLHLLKNTAVLCHITPAIIYTQKPDSYMLRG